MKECFKYFEKRIIRKAIITIIIAVIGYFLMNMSGCSKDNPDSSNNNGNRDYCEVLPGNNTDCN